MSAPRTAAVAAETVAPAPILVLGLGNILLSDEGVGVRAVEALCAGHRLPPEVDAIDGGTAGMDLLDLIIDREHLIVIDAVRLDAPPGTTVRLTGNEIAPVLRTRLSPHQLGLLDVLAAITLLDTGPKTVTVIGIVPACLDLDLSLSPVIAASLDGLLAQVIDELAGLGATVASLP